jgi:two-component system NtrC family response regulator
LNVVHVQLPSLSQRRDDLPLLVNHFFTKNARENRQEPISISSGAMERLLEYNWPGNVRELENVIERAIILSDGHQIQIKDLPSEVREHRPEPPGSSEEKNAAPRDFSVPGLAAGDRVQDSGLKVRQMRAMEFIKLYGFITNKHYSQLAAISERQALRELNELVETGRLVRVGKGRACRYVEAGDVEQ